MLRLPFPTTLAVAALAFVCGSQDPPPEASGGIVTLWARDALAASLGLEHGGPAARIVGGEVDLSGAQLVFGAFAPGLLSFGFDLEELVDVVDLGDLVVPPRQRAAEDALQFPISVFHTLALDRGRFVYRDADGDLQRLQGADHLLGSLPPAGLRHLEPVVGHTYLLRHRSRRGGPSDRVVKLQVLGLRPGESVTLRWAPLARL